MKTINTQEEAMAAISECVKTVNEQLEVAKKIADQWGLVLNVNINPSKSDDQDPWATSDTWMASGCSY